MKSRSAIVPLLVLAMAACGERPGQPETATTATPEAATTTNPASATTTGETGGTASTMHPDDKELVIDAGMIGLAEVQLGELALRTSVDEPVQNYARKMVEQHNVANQDLQLLATTKGLALPAELEGDAEQAMNDLSSLTGDAFDGAYMNQMIATHLQTIDRFETALPAIRDADVRRWIEKMLPMLREHLEEAKTIATEL
jgi:putative membrane protein